VCNAMVLTEGWDAPEVSCLVLARPTRSLGLYRQMVGRVLRASPDKTDALILDHAGAVFMHGLPEEPVLWTLDEDHKAENSAQSARQKHHAPALVECPECAAIRLEGQPCPACGWTPRPKPKPVEMAPGDLARVQRDRSVTGEDTYAPLAFHGQLLHYARNHNPPYRDGWAAHKFKEKFGYWPPRNVTPMPPSPAVQAWIRSRQIAYARSQAKADR
jgi:DNA repair protein RadD